MAFILDARLLAFIFGLLGNIVSFLVFLAPVPTFYQIYKKKSSEGYQSLPYSVALFSAALLLYYAFLKTNAYMIVSINGIGCTIEITYLAIYFYYAPNKLKMATMKLIILFNVGGLVLVMIITFLLVKGPERVTVVGWICAAINLAVYAAPLSILRQVIRTKSVEFMPFTLSFFLTICATMWFFYGFFVKDYFIALPNVMGFLFGITQMILYMIYKDAKKNNEEKSGKWVTEEATKSCIADEEKGNMDNINVQVIVKMERERDNNIVCNRCFPFPFLFHLNAVVV